VFRASASILRSPSSRASARAAWPSRAASPAPHLLARVEAFDLPHECLDGVPLANGALELRFDQVVEGVSAQRPFELGHTAAR
jgi:hypothetical protein